MKSAWYVDDIAYPLMINLEIIFPTENYKSEMLAVRCYQNTFKYLRHAISRKEVASDPKKIQDIKKWSEHCIVTQV